MLVVRSNKLQIENVKLAVYKWLEFLDLVPKNQIVRMEQNVPRPKAGTYIGFSLISGPLKTGFNDNQEYVSASTSTFKTWGQREFTFDIQVFRENALQYAAYIADSHEVQEVRDKLREYNIAIIDISPPSSIDELIQTGYEDRANIDVRLRAMSDWDQDLGSIDTLQTTGTLTSDSGSEVVI